MADQLDGFCIGLWKIMVTSSRKEAVKKNGSKKEKKNGSMQGIFGFKINRVGVMDGEKGGVE